MGEQNGTPAEPSGNAPERAQTVPSHRILVEAGNQYRVALEIDFPKEMPYAMADAIKQGADPLSAFLGAMQSIAIASIAVAVRGDQPTPEQPLIQPAKAIPPVRPRFLRP